MTAPLRIVERELGQIDPLAKGGTAQLFRVPALQLPDLPGTALVYKRYTEKTRRTAGAPLGPGLTTFVRFRDKLPDRQRALWDERIIWPVRVVVDDSQEVTGILMPLIPDRFFHAFRRRSGPPQSRPREVDTLFGDTPTMLRVGLPEIDRKTRLRLVLGIAGAYGMMHKEGVVLGDISARNVIYDPDPARPAVLVIDVDSARIAGTRSVFSTQPHTPNWQPPEALEADRTLHYANTGRLGLTSFQRDRLRNTWSIQSTKTDVYKFGLMVVRILDPGRGKAVNRDPSAAKRVLRQERGAEAADLLTRSLQDDPQRRPTMREWYDVLGGGVSRRAEPAKGSNPRPAPGIPDGRRVGNWVWREGTGWIRSSA